MRKHHEIHSLTLYLWNINSFDTSMMATQCEAVPGSSLSHTRTHTADAQRTYATQMMTSLISGLVSVICNLITGLGHTGTQTEERHIPAQLFV